MHFKLSISFVVCCSMFTDQLPVDAIAKGSGRIGSDGSDYIQMKYQGAQFRKQCSDYCVAQAPPPGIRYLRLQLHGTNSRISPPARPDVLLYFHLFGSVGPRGGANLLATRLLHGAGRLRTLPFAGADRLTDALSFHFPFFPASASSPSWRGFRVRASVYTIPPMCNGSVPTSATANYWFHCLPSAASEVHFCNFAPRLANSSSPQIKSRREKNRNLIKIRRNVLFFFFPVRTFAKAVQM